MTRILISLVALAGLANTALAHVPGAEESFIDSLRHVFFGAHHLPALLLLAGFLVALTLVIRRARATRDED